MSERNRDLPAPVPDDDVEFWEAMDEGDHSLVDLVNRVLDKGVVITGDVTLSVAGIDLVYLGLNAVLTSVSTLRKSRGDAPPGASGDAG